MTALNIVPFEETEHRTSFTGPTGSYYMLGTPSVSLARELINSGINRVVFATRQPRKDWPKAARLLAKAGIEIVEKNLTLT